MTRAEQFILFAPFFGLLLAMALAFGVQHWRDNRNHRN